MTQKTKNPLMNNSIYNFRYVEAHNLKIRNPTEYCILPKIPNRFKSNNMVLQMTLQDDRLLESICFELYKTTDYWDILMVLNGMTSTFDLPVNTDTLLSRVLFSFDEWYKHGKLQPNERITEQYNEVIEILKTSTVTTKYHENHNDEMVKRKYLEILEEKTRINEKHRNFKYISISDMTDLISELKILESINYPVDSFIIGKLSYRADSDIEMNINVDSKNTIKPNITKG